MLELCRYRSVWTLQLDLGHVSDAKVEKLGYPTDEDPINAPYYMQVIDLIPRTSYYIGAGIEENGDLCVVVVMADG